MTIGPGRPEKSNFRVTHFWFNQRNENAFRAG
jgi:hypothetical protein